jgi:lipoprotein-releasing system permease protein
MRVELFLAWKYLFRGKARHISFISIVACIGVILGVSTLVVVISVMNGFDRDLTAKLLNFNYHLLIEGPDERELSMIGRKIKGIEDVESVSLFLHTQVFAKFDSHILPLVVKGLDFKDKKEHQLFYKFVKEEYTNSGFFVGQGLKKRYLLGEKIAFYPLQRKLKLKEAPVRGTFRIGLYDLDNSYLVCDLKEAKNLGPNYLLFLGVRIKSPFEADKVKEKIEERLGYPLHITTWMDANRALFSALRLEKITMFVILSLITVVATFSIFSTLMVKVVEKTKDIGILKAIGFTSKRILSVFTIQGLLLGGIGVLLGIGLGFILCFILKEYHFIKIPKEIYYIDYLPVYVESRDMILISLLGLILSFLASFFPARRASKLDVCQALRYE